MIKKKKLPTMKRLKKDADKVFSDFIRQRDKGRCYTCDNIKDWTEQQNGHYMSRRHTNTRYDEENCHCQCVSCNVFLRGNMPLYAIRLQKQYGNDILKDLFRKAHTTIKCDRLFLDKIIKKYGRK